MTARPVFALPVRQRSAVARPGFAAPLRVVTASPLVLPAAWWVFGLSGACPALGPHYLCCLLTVVGCVALVLTRPVSMGFRRLCRGFLRSLLRLGYGPPVLQIST